MTERPYSTGKLEELSRESLIQHMVGRPLDAVFSRDECCKERVLLRVDNVSRGLLRDISFEIKAGEILGLAGLMGAGRTELCRVLFGLDPPASRHDRNRGKEDLLPRTPREAVQAGVALIPEDRQHNGLALRLPIAHNITMPDLGTREPDGVSAEGPRRSAVSQQYRQQLRIKCHSPSQVAGSLSGGNQQKIVIAKWVARGAKIFMFDEPTRGIDVGAKQEVFEQMAALGAGRSRDPDGKLRVARVDPSSRPNSRHVRGTYHRRTSRKNHSGGDHEACRPANELTGDGTDRMSQKTAEASPVRHPHPAGIALTIATPKFLTQLNLTSLVRQTAVINIMSLGMTLVIISGGIDLSVGSTLAISGLFGTMAIKAGMPDSARDLGWNYSRSLAVGS